MSDIREATIQDPLGSNDFGGASDGGSFGSNNFGGSSGGGSRGDKFNLRDQAAEKLRSFADEGKQQVTNSLDGLVEAARELANKVGEHGGPLGGYANTAAETLEQWADTVKSKSVEDLLDDGREFARQSPAVAVGIAVAVGFALSRLLKAGGSDGRYVA